MYHTARERARVLARWQTGRDSPGRKTRTKQKGYTGENKKERGTTGFAATRIPASGEVHLRRRPALTPQQRPRPPGDLVRQRQVAKAEDVAGQPFEIGLV